MTVLVETPDYRVLEPTLVDATNKTKNINNTSMGESFIPLLISVLSIGKSLHSEERLPLNLGGSGIALWIPVSHLSSGVVIGVLRTGWQWLQRQAFGHIGQRLKCIQERERLTNWNPVAQKFLERQRKITFGMLGFVVSLTWPKDLFSFAMQSQNY